MRGRMTPKLKVSLTLDADLVALVDRSAERRNRTRSRIVEEWLRLGAQDSSSNRIDEATAAYYRRLSAVHDAAEENLSRALSSAARRVDYDDARPRRRR
jgi:metal-responsive CopG/Arc/MetJ family transcriptional regulator